MTSSTTVALTPASQAAQYVDCSLAELDRRIRANGGEPQRIGKVNYYLWDDVVDLRQAARPVAGCSTTRPAKRSPRTAPDVPHQREAKAPQPARTATAGRSRTATPTNGGKPAKAASAGKTGRPATVDERTAGNRGTATAPIQRKPWPTNPEAEIAELAKLPKEDLLAAAVAFGMAPPYPYRRRPIAEYIVNAKAANRKTDRVAPGQAGKAELAARRKSRTAKPAVPAFKAAR